MALSHWVFGIAAPLGVLECVKVSTGTLTVDTTQLLAMRDARLILRQFLETRTFPLGFHRQDVTERFRSVHYARSESVEAQRFCYTLGLESD